MSQASKMDGLRLHERDARKSGEKHAQFPHGQYSLHEADCIAWAIERIERLEQALEDIVGHGVSLPPARYSDLTDGEWRWYVRGLDSQRRIAAAALRAEKDGECD